MAKESHVSSYENLKEIFAGHKQRLLNFFAKKSIYDDDKVTMQSYYAFNDKQNFIYNWYNNNSYIVDKDIFRKSFILGYNNRTLETNNSTFEDNYIFGYGNTLSYWCQRNNIIGYGNSLYYVYNSSFTGQGNYVSYNENLYSLGKGDCKHLNVVGHENHMISNVGGAYQDIYILGHDNGCNVYRTSVIEQTRHPTPWISESTLIGFSNQINFNTPDVNYINVNMLNLRNINIFGEGNYHYTYNRSNTIYNKEGMVTLVGCGNSTTNLKNCGCYGHSNTIGTYGSLNNENDIFYNIFAYGYNNNASYQETTPIHDCVMAGIGNSMNQNTSNSFSFGYYNSAYNTGNSVLVGLNNYIERITSDVCVFGRYNNVGIYDGSYLSNNIVVGNHNEVRHGSNVSQFGTYIKNDYDNQVSIGNFNENSDDNYFEFGNGTDDEHRHNVAVITRSGDLILNDGDVINEDGESLTTLRTDIDLLDGRVEDLEDAVDNIEDDIDLLESTVEDLGTTVDGLSNDVESLDDTVDTLSGSVDALDIRVGNNERDITALEGQVAQLTLSLADALARISELENIVMNEKTNHVQLYTEDGDTRITEDGDNKFTEEVLS